MEDSVQAYLVDASEAASYCRGCKRATPKVKVSTFTRIPHYLVLHISRFTGDLRKAQVPTQLQEEVTIQGKKFRLLGFLLHKHGDLDLSKGHYICLLSQGLNLVVLQRCGGEY